MKIIVTILLVLSIVSCSKNSLKSEFNCDSKSNFSETKEFRDVLKKFKIGFPSTWKTQLYYDDFKSEILSADTTKQLAQAYILDVTWAQGELNLNEKFAKGVADSLAINEQLNTIKSDFGIFKERPMYWNLSQGKKSGKLYTYLQVYVKTNLDEYFSLTSKVYGKEDVDARLCESIALFDEIIFIE